MTTESQVLALIQELQKRLGMAVVLISHNLGVIAQMCRRVYRHVRRLCRRRRACRRYLYRPAHPYTQGLLASLPDPSRPDKELTGIDGQAPDLFHMPAGCRFIAAARRPCASVRIACRRRMSWWRPSRGVLASEPGKEEGL